MQGEYLTHKKLLTDDFPTFYMINAKLFQISPAFILNGKIHVDINGKIIGCQKWLRHFDFMDSSFRQELFFALYQSYQASCRGHKRVHGVDAFSFFGKKFAIS